MLDHLRLAAAALGWVCLALAATLGLGGAARQGEGYALGWPGWAVLGAAALGAWLAARASRPGDGRLMLGLAPAPLALLLGVPFAGVAALSGPPLVALVLAGLALLLARRPPPAWMFVPICVGLYVCVALRVQTQLGAEGDEPHYLMVAESLLRDGDVSVEDDYAAGRYRPFYRSQPTLEPHFMVRGRQGEVYSLHALGLSLLVLPAYALGGYPAASIFMALLLALLARELRTLLRTSLDDAAIADGLAWVLALSPPLVHFAGLIFTEVPAALAVAFALNRLRDPHRLTPRTALAVGAALAFLPWLNVRYLPFPLLFLVYAAWARPPRRTLVLLGLPLLFSAAAIGLYHFALYGFFDPRLVYGRRPGFAWRRLWPNLEALLLDQEFGLLCYAPVFALALPGCVALVRRTNLRTLFVIAVPVGVVLATATTWRMWWGGFTPPARFLLPVVPLLAVAVGLGLRRGVGARAALLMGWSLFLGLAGAWQPRLVHRDRDGTSPLLRAVSGAEEWTRLLPAYVAPDADPARQRLALLWGAVLLVAVWPRRREKPATALGLALSAGGLIAAAGLASSFSLARTGGRDAVRVLGRHALEVPGLRAIRSATGDWGTEALAWGPLYEEHRFPDGAEFASRLALPPAHYRLSLTLEAVPGARPLSIVALREPGWRRETMPANCTGAGGGGPPSTPPLEEILECRSAFVIASNDRAVSLRLASGGPFLFRHAHLAADDPAQPSRPAPGPSH